MSRISIATLLLPWRLVPIILQTESDKALSSRVMLGLALLAALFADVSVFAGRIAPNVVWMFTAAVAVYCAALLVFSFVILNSVSNSGQP